MVASSSEVDHLMYGAIEPEACMGQMEAVSYMGAGLFFFLLA